MAPSFSRRVAPSSSTSTSTQPLKGVQKQLKSALNLNSTSFGRVTKSKSKTLKVKFEDVRKHASTALGWDCEEQKTAVEDVKVEKETVLEIGGKRKRTRSADENDSESERSEAQVREQSKKRRVQSHEQLLSPPASREGTDCDENSHSRSSLLPSSPRSRRRNAALSSLVQLPSSLVQLPSSLVQLPSSLLDLISMFAAFVKALSLHFAHNGASSPAELNALMSSMTRLWKKQTIQRSDVQRMLGLYEIAADSTMVGAKQVSQNSCPFKITTSGLGSNVRTNLEYVGQASYSENTLQATYSDMVHTCFNNNPDLDSHTKFPLLTITLGTQTSLHRSKAASTRNEILGLSAAAQSRSAPDFSKLSISDPLDHTTPSVKSRTLSLFDRVRAKGIASANNGAPTSDQIARKHALGRISEIVEFLRMKQQQKLSTQFQSSVHDSPGKIRGIGKVSFSLVAITRDVRQSVSVPIGEEEVKMCLKILSQELPGDWCRMIELGSVVSITLQGNGPSGHEVKRLLETKRF